MIAAGLCLMGGCFAQDVSGMVADAYWPSSKVSVPPFFASSSVGLYEYDEVPIGVSADDIRVYTKQLVIGDFASFFFVFQNNDIAYNAYCSSALKHLKSNTSEDKCENDTSLPKMVELDISKLGATYRNSSLAVPPCIWQSNTKGARLRLLDSRTGEKYFFVSYGACGWQWYLLSMCSVLSTEAVFDFEAKVLVEL